jgi:xylulokinase
MSHVLTFDLGTSYFKICLFDEALGLVARKRIAVPVDSPAPGRSELPVPVFCDCLTAGVHDVSRQAGGLRDVSRVCFASQANSFTLLDGNSRALIPFLLWVDERACGMEASLRSLTSRSDFYATTGVAQLDHYFMIAKLRWLHEHQPEIIGRTRRLCGMSDYLVLWLTGNHLTEAGLMGLTGLANIHCLRYWSDAVRYVELPIEWLPQIARAGSDAGRLRSEIAQEWGLPSDCRLIMGCLDQYAGAIGAGNTEPGYVSETTGTVLATVRCAREFSPLAAPDVFQGPAFSPGIYYQMVFSDLSAGLLERYRNQLPDHPTFSELDTLAAQVPAGAEGLRLHPTVLSRNAPVTFDGRMRSHHRGHEVRAIMEAVAVELRRQVDTLCGRDWPSLVRAAGGAARSRLWLQIKSQVLGCPVRAVNSLEPTSMGAARLAQLAADI